MELDTNAHSVFLLYYHLVLVVKYRRPVFECDFAKGDLSILLQKKFRSKEFRAERMDLSRVRSTP
jgi:putative transposase